MAVGNDTVGELRKEPSFINGVAELFKSITNDGGSLLIIGGAGDPVGGDTAKKQQRPAR